MSVSSQFLDYTTRLRDLNTPLRLLTESELSRLSVWVNPTNDIKRSTDATGATERGLFDTTWVALIHSIWNIDPAIVVHLPERFKLPLIRHEVSRLVRSSPKQVLHVCEAVHFLLGENFDPTVWRDHKVGSQANHFSNSYFSSSQYLLLWQAVPPIIATTYFEQRYNNQPHILQYAHRVLEEHPVELTFFFIPQVVQALRYDTLGEFHLTN